MIELKPCPCCGPDGHPELHGSINRGGRFVRCEICGMQGPANFSQEKATTAWNTRADRDRIEALTAENERMREALDMLDQRSEALGGCSDGSCVIHRPKGMHTNGGCRCWNDRDKMRRWTQYVGYFRHKARAALGETE